MQKLRDRNKLTQKKFNHSTTKDNFLNVAPGEGQIPTSILKEKEWDIKTYPHLYPDGKNGMHAENRKVRLTNQQYIQQRLFNIDKRFSNDPGYLFSATWHIENLQLERNIQMAYTHGSKKAMNDLSRTYQVNSCHHVFHKIKDTPDFWLTKNMSY